MKKVLIISYFFPPSNFAGSYRISSWAKHLHKYGYFPVVITRCWNPNQTDITDLVIDNTYSEEVSDEAQIIRVPYRNTLRDRLHHASVNNFNVWLRKFLSLWELVIQNFFPKAIPYYRMYITAEAYIRKHNDIDVIVVSGRPFHSFLFGYMLAKKTGIPWVADYRDEWSTTKLKQSSNILDRFVMYLEKRSEKKWLSNAAAFITCSGNWQESIGTFIQKPGYVVLNGYDPDDYMNIKPISKSPQEFWIVFNGTLYPTQRIEVFLEAVKQIEGEGLSAKKIVLHFPGLKVYPQQEQRVINFLEGSGVEVVYSGRSVKPAVIALQKASDLLLMVAHDGVKGNHSSKIFEYFACEVPILLCPSDHDVIEAFVHETKSGYCADTVAECKTLILEAMDKGLAYNPDMEKGSLYTRQRQAQVLANCLDDVIAGN